MSPKDFFRPKRFTQIFCWPQTFLPKIYWSIDKVTAINLTTQDPLCTSIVVNVIRTLFRNCTGPGCMLCDHHWKNVDKKCTIFEFSSRYNSKFWYDFTNFLWPKDLTEILPRKNILKISAPRLWVRFWPFWQFFSFVLSYLFLLRTLTVKIKMVLMYVLLRAPVYVFSW